MRIGFLTPGPADQISGGYLYDRMCAAYCREHGDDVSMLSLPHRSYLAGVLDSFSGRLEERLLSSPPEILLEDAQGHPAFAHLNERLRKRKSFPIVALIHHLRGRNIRYLRSVDGFIFNSAAAEKETANLLGRPLLSLVAPPGRDSLPAWSVEKKDGEPGNDVPLTVIYVGNVIRRKGLHVLLEALSRLKEIDWQLRVVGDLWLERSYVESIRSGIMWGGIAGRIRFYGRVSETKLCDLLRSAHLLAVPALDDGSGQCYLEAMGHGLPVIATRSYGTEGLVTDGKEGFVIQPQDPAVLALRVWQLARDPQMRLAMSRNALRRFLQAPTWEESCAHIHGFLCGLERSLGRTTACAAVSPA